MAVTDLIPWKKSDNRLALRQREIDPFSTLREEIDQIFSRMLGDWTGRNLFNTGMRTFMPTVDIKETGKEIRVTAELPGLDQKDLNVSMLDGMLTIKGEKREEHEDDKGETYRCECRYGAFERMVQLPAEVDINNVRASFKRGVLKITLPKTKEAQSNRRVVPIET